MGDRLFIVLLFIGFTVACVGIASRIEAESDQRTVEVILDYASVDAFVRNYDMDPHVVLREWGEAGITAVAVDETTVDDLIQQGIVAIWRPAEWGGGLPFDLLGLEAEQLGSQWDAPALYVAWQNDTVPPWLHEELTVFGERLGQFVDSAPQFTVVRFASEADHEAFERVVRRYALGFDSRLITALHDQGFRIVLRPQGDAYQEPFDIRRRLARLTLPGEAYGPLVFAGDALRMEDEWLDVWRDVVSETGQYVALIEMAHQRGVSQLITSLEYGGIRLHSISSAEFRNMTRKIATARWLRAVKERSIQALYVRVYDTVPTNGEKHFDAMHFNTEYITTLIEELENIGYTPGPVQPHRMPSLSVAWLVFIAMAVGVCSVMLLRLFLQTPRWFEYSIVVGWGAIALCSHLELVRQGVALGTAIIMPTLATCYALRWSTSKQSTWFVGPTGRFVTASTISFIGAVFVAAFLSATPFAMGLSVFAGVKLMHVVPPAIVALHTLWGAPVRDSRRIIGRISRIIRRRVPLYFIAVLGCIGVLTAVIVLRTGNDMLPALGWEQTIRQWLENTLGVRPRTKEFLLGHPMFLLTAYGCVHRIVTREWQALAAAVASVGQLSLVNTFAHIHTPFVISVLRTIYGLIIGLLIGLVFIAAWSWIRRRWHIRTKRGGGWKCAL